MRKIINILCFISLIVLTICPTSKVEAASATLKDFKNDLAKVQAEKAENNRLTNQSIQQIDAKRNAILNANNTIKDNEDKVEEAKEKVLESQEEIKIKSEELKDVIRIMQYSKVNSAEMYMDYIIDSSSISELMERQKVVEQIINHTQKQLDDLDALIKKNEKLQVTLAEDIDNLNQNITDYERQVAELEAFIEKRATIGLDYDEKIKAYKNNIKAFEEAGCKDNDLIDICFYSKGMTSGAFSRPLNSGRVTQAWGNNGHKGMDLGGNPKGTPVYAPASGTVAHVAYKQRCGGNEIYMHFNVGGKAYTGEFAHLTAIYVKPGQKVTKGTVIGTVGGDSSTWYYDKCTSGTHLHYSIAYGYYLGSGANGYSKWSTFTANTKATSVQSITGFKNQAGWRWSGRG